MKWLMCISLQRSSYYGNREDDLDSDDDQDVSDSVIAS